MIKILFDVVVFIVVVVTVPLAFVAARIAWKWANLKLKSLETKVEKEKDERYKGL